MNSFRAFIAGIIFPTILLPILLFTAIGYDKPQLLQIPFIHLIPIIWGLWNAFSVAVSRFLPPETLTVRYILAGGALGLFIALYGVFIKKVPQILGFEQYFYYPLIGMPIAYAIFWVWVVKPLNDLLGVQES